MKSNFLSKFDKELEDFARMNFSHFKLKIPMSNIREVAEETIPDRIRVIQGKSNLSNEEESLLDQIGIDFVFEMYGVRFAVDVTTGSSTVIKNKKRKLKSINKFLDHYKLTPVVLTVRSRSLLRELTEEIIRSPVCKNTGVIDCRLA